MFSHTHIPFRQFPRLFPVVTVLFSVQAVFFLVMTLLGGTQYIPNLIRFVALEPHLVSTGVRDLPGRVRPGAFVVA